ncbi:hypothetical protein Q7P35_005902 [Cladosporium inversicolor]
MEPTIKANHKQLSQHPPTNPRMDLPIHRKPKHSRTAHRRPNNPQPTPGTLKLDPSMADFLSTALPNPVQQKPVSLFNLFKYQNNDPAVLEQYMRDFKNGFGDSAGE